MLLPWQRLQEAGCTGTPSTVMHNFSSAAIVAAAGPADNVENDDDDMHDATLHKEQESYPHHPTRTHHHHSCKCSTHDKPTTRAPLREGLRWLTQPWKHMSLCQATLCRNQHLLRPPCARVTHSQHDASSEWLWQPETGIVLCCCTMAVRMRLQALLLQESINRCTS